MTRVKTELSAWKTTKKAVQEDIARRAYVNIFCCCNAQRPQPGTSGDLSRLSHSRQGVNQIKLLVERRFVAPANRTGQ